MTVGAMTADALAEAYRGVRERLLAERNQDGWWVGELSSSALSTATAVAALCLVNDAEDRRRIAEGLAWLSEQQNGDGGWGDTPESPSNLATTLLTLSAFAIAGDSANEAVARGERYLAERAGPSPQDQTAAIAAAYGEDRTFSVPILVTCALAGRVAWHDIPRLPFELAAIPHRWLRLLRAHVVSYALPALVAIGQLLHVKRPTALAPLRWLRQWAVAPTLRRLRAIQPETGGYIEAVPLTSFVAMSLAAAGRADHPVVADAVRFLRSRVRPDGSWPIDTDLSTWATTLATGALAAGPGGFTDDLRPAVKHVADCQQVERHPFTDSAPGGWAWTDLAGGVPDADDTAGALAVLALSDGDRERRSAETGVRWLLGLQNRDGGWPTFCRGWGRLPFDRSAPDLTSHALRALDAWRERLPHLPIGRAMRRGLKYLARRQRQDGSWLPLWFGNQHAPRRENPVFGTARVLNAYRDLRKQGDAVAARGVAYLLEAQNADGSWGGAPGVPGSVEETGAVVSALTGWHERHDARDAVGRGTAWLVDRVRSGTIDNAAPLGLYFTELWYHERLYPLIWAAEALGRVIRTMSPGHVQADRRS